ncbi:hypothetical protein [Bacillus cereus]|uniref:hypothetical protein n=1 Tax=Bacillus cereus TaxID=1396 RepID=UPI0009435AF7|nr:hypothetical protein [Bacillus cereus]
MIAGFEEKARLFLKSCGCKLTTIKEDTGHSVGCFIYFIDMDGREVSSGELHVIKGIIKPRETEINAQRNAIKWLQKDKEKADFIVTKELIEAEILKLEQSADLLEETLAVWRYRIAELESRD